MNQQILAEKKDSVAQLNEVLAANQSAIVVSYSALSVAEVNKLRGDLKKNGSKLLVQKNSLVKKAIHDGALSPLEPLLKGPNAIVVSKEAGDGINTLKEFAAAHKNFSMKGGVLAGTFCDTDKLGELANVGNKENALASLLSTIQSPLVMFALTLKALAEKDQPAA